MFEVEYKYRLNEDQQYIPIIEKYGFKLQGTLNQVDLVFEKSKNEIDILRIRQESEKTILTHKIYDKVNDCILENEINICSDIGHIIEFVKGQNYNFVANVRKTRKTYLFKDILLALDVVEDLGKFIEIETLVTDVKKIKYAKSKLKFLANSMKLNKNNIETRHYYELMKVKNDLLH